MNAKEQMKVFFFSDFFPSNFEPPMIGIICHVIDFGMTNFRPCLFSLFRPFLLLPITLISRFHPEKNIFLCCANMLKKVGKETFGDNCAI